MNINCAYEFWVDVNIPPLHVVDNKPAIVYLPFLIVVGNAILNAGPFLLLHLASTVACGDM